MTISSRRVWAVCAAGLLSAAMSSAQSANQSSAQSPYYGSVSTVQPVDGVKPLTLNQAIAMGIEHNLALVEAKAQERSAQARTLQQLQPLLPTITAQADSGAHQINLAAIGFSPNLLGRIAPLFPGLDFTGFSDRSQGQCHRRPGELLADPLQP